MRNELVLENPKTEEGLIGLLEYRINAATGRNKRHPDSLYEEKKKKREKYYGKSITAQYFGDIYGIDPFLEGSRKYWENHPQQRKELMIKVNQAKEKWQQEHPEEHQKQVEQWRQAGSKANSQKVRCITTNEIFES